MSRSCFLSTFCFLFAYLFMSSLLSSSEAGEKRSWAPTFGLPKHCPPRLNKAYNEKKEEKKRKVNMGLLSPGAVVVGRTFCSSRGLEFVWVFFFRLFFFIFVNQTPPQINICLAGRTMCRPGLAWRIRVTSDSLELLCRKYRAAEVGVCPWT